MTDPTPTPGKALDAAREIAADTIDRLRGGRMSVSQRMRDGRADDHDAVQCALAALTAPVAGPEALQAGDWKIDRSTGTDILMFKKCSVIEDDQAHLVMSLLAAAARSDDTRLDVAREVLTDLREHFAFHRDRDRLEPIDAALRQIGGAE